MVHATRKHSKKWKIFPGVEPLNIIAADNSMFAAGVSLINGWLFHTHMYPQRLQLLSDADKNTLQVVMATSPSHSWWHDLQAANRLNRWDLYTRNLNSS